LALLAPAALAHDKDDDSDDAWVFVRSDDNSSMHGDLRDLKRARKFLGDQGPGYLWFRRDGKEYIVRDDKLVQEIDALERPQQELGEEQSRLGRKQSELGKEQSKLGKRQGELGQAQAEMA